jgi:hypothetical protein
MWKYWTLLVVIAGVGLFYVYRADPCNRLARMEFSARYPSFKLLDTAAEEGSPETVRCRITYRKPDSKQMHEDVWLYQNRANGWEFSRIIESRPQEQAR